jgi:AraC family transcriptional regulator
VVSDLEGEALTTLAIESTIERDGGRARRRTGAKLDARRLARVQAFLESRISARLTLTALADVAAVSRHHFCVMFRRTTGQTPHAYLTALRMQRASELLARGATVEASAAAVGYKAAHQFRKAFQATFGMSARAFRSKSGY